MVRAHVVISGFVQGVGFRFFIERKTKELGLTGWVRNTSDGNVEALFEGSKEDVEKMVGECKKGPFLASVADVKATIGEATGEFSDFILR